MTTKAFFVLIAAVVLLGGSIGGAFAGGLALGKRQDNGSASTPVTTTPSDQQETAFPLFGAGDLSEFQERIQSGEVTQEELADLRQQFQAGGGGGFRGGGAFGGQGVVGGGGFTGTLEEIDGSTLVVSTIRGPLEVNIGSDTIIQTFAEGKLEDLVLGLTVTVTSQPSDGGIPDAISIVINPAGVTGGFFGEGQRRGGFPGGAGDALPGIP